MYDHLGKCRPSRTQSWSSVLLSGSVTPEVPALFSAACMSDQIPEATSLASSELLRPTCT